MLFSIEFVIPNYPFPIGNFKILETSGDGNCFLWAFLDQARLRYHTLYDELLRYRKAKDGIESLLNYLREKTAETLETAVSFLNPDVINFYIELLEDNSIQTISDLQLKIRSNTEYYEYLSICGLATYFKVTVVIWQRSHLGDLKEILRSVGCQNPAVHFHVWFNGSNHFETMHDSQCNCEFCLSGEKIDKYCF